MRSLFEMLKKNAKPDSASVYHHLILDNVHWRVIGPSGPICISVRPED